VWWCIHLSFGSFTRRLLRIEEGGFHWIVLIDFMIPDSGKSEFYILISFFFISSITSEGIGTDRSHLC
jgi:hypothetical protein